MCIANNREGAVSTSKGRRNKDGSLTPNARLLPGEKWEDKHGATRIMTAKDVPLGTGSADAARLSILNRREAMRRALEEN